MNIGRRQAIRKRADDSVWITVGGIVPVKENEGTEAAQIAKVLGDSCRDSAFAISGKTVQPENILFFGWRGRPVSYEFEYVLTSPRQAFGS
jgi:hypothetical protein